MTHNDNLPYTSFFDKRSGIAERLTPVYSMIILLTSIK